MPPVPLRIDRRELALNTAIASLAALAILLVPVYSSHDFRPRLYAAVGHPFGLTPQVYVALALVAIWLPFPVWCWSLQVVRRHAKVDPSRVKIEGSPQVIGLWQIIQHASFLVKLRGAPRSLQRAKLLTLGGYIYGIGLVVWWIAWTSSKGI